MTSPKCDDEDPACQDVSASTRLVLFFSRFVLFDLSAWRETFSAAPAAICFGAPDLSAFATGQSRFLIVPNLGVSALQTAWAASCLGMEFALNFMKNNAGIDRLRQQVGRLDVAADELEGRNQRSSLFKTMFLAYRAAGAKDWRSQVAIA